MIFNNRQHAGKKLAQRLLQKWEEGSLDLSNAAVIALPRGGVPIGFEISKALKLPLDVCIVRKVGAPMQPELAVAAVAEGGEIVVNENIQGSLGLSDTEIEKLAKTRREEVKVRVKKFRGERAAINIRGKVVILVDDGLATGATALSAIHVIRKMQASKIVLALPVCPEDAVNRFRQEVDELVVLSTPEVFYAVGQSYADFDQISDEQVKALLDQANSLQFGD